MRTPRPATRTPSVALVAAGFLVALGLAGCVGGPSPTPTGASASPSVAPTAPLAGEKRAADVKLPKTLGEWTVSRALPGPSGQRVQVYAHANDAANTVRVIVSSVPLTQAALDAVLTGQQRFGTLTCGQLPGGDSGSCYVPLSGGSLSVAASLPLDQLATLTQQLYDQL